MFDGFQNPEIYGQISQKQPIFLQIMHNKHL